MKNFFTVLGGMGTMATESYIRLLNKRTPTQNDQDYLNYIIVNHASVPDRTAYILDNSQPNFLPDLLEDVKQQSILNPKFMVLICNTAHYFYDVLSSSTNVPLLNMPHIAIKELITRYPNAKRIGLIATEGTLHDNVYKNELLRYGINPIIGDYHVQRLTMRLIYEYIKEKGIVNASLYHDILKIMREKYGCEVVILGCTELSLANEVASDSEYNVIDAQSIIVDKSIELAESFRHKSVEETNLLLKELLK